MPTDVKSLAQNKQIVVIASNCRRKNGTRKMTEITTTKLYVIRWAGDYPTLKGKFRDFSLFWCKSVVLGPPKHTSRLLAGKQVILDVDTR